jgi:formate hydrogenlyase transcriptional activator
LILWDLQGGFCEGFCHGSDLLVGIVEYGSHLFKLCNIRELQNVIERSVIVCESEIFSVDESWLSRQPQAAESKGKAELSVKIAAQEKQMIEAALKESAGRVFGLLGAATRLGIPRSTLESKIRSLRIDKNRFKPLNA